MRTTRKHISTQQFSLWGSHNNLSVCRNKLSEIIQYIDIQWFDLFLRPPQKLSSYILKSSVRLLCGLLFLLSSCREIAIIDENEIPGNAITYKEGNVNFVINFENYGENSDISTRSTEGQETETVIVPLEDGLSMIATLRESTRGEKHAAALRSFNPSARMHIVAYEEHPGLPYSFMERIAYIVNSGGTNPTLTRDGTTGFELEIDHTYRFVAYSYNDDVTPLPVGVFTNTIEDINTGVVDLIWGESDPVHVIADTPTDVLIKMRHKFSKINLQISSVQPISTISNIDMLPDNMVNMTVEDGIISLSSTVVNQRFSYSTPLPATSLTMDERLVYTDEAKATMIRIGTLDIGSHPFQNLFATFAKQLKSGFAYDMNVRIGNATDLTDDTPPANFIPYIGAFWKNNQYGERLIRMVRPTVNLSTGMPLSPSEATVADSIWTAVVVTGDDWIKLDTQPSSDNVWTSGGPAWKGNDAGFDDAPRLITGSQTYISGYMDENDPQIYFRIGLTGPNYDPSPRYGMVLLTYANNKKRQRIWIRQGEGYDYLMKPGDPDKSGVAVANNRSFAAKFPPYNLTAQGSMNGPVRNNYSIPLSSLPPAVFTDYPSQAGAFFQWANTINPSYAWAPTGIVPGWNNNASTDYWNILFDSHETCPDGYRRPFDGTKSADNISGSVTGSEIRQSLWVNPPTGQNTVGANSNSVWGYYADGFFDRQQIETAPGSSGAQLSAVSVTNNDVAYIGRVFYNPATSASLFFPVAGHREPLSSTGLNGSYWTGTSYNNINGWYMDMDNGSTGMSYMLNSGALSIRCIYEPPVMGVTLARTDGSNPVSIGSAATLLASVSPVEAENVHYIWQIFDGTNWNSFAETSSNSSNVPVMFVGNNEYRVTAYNQGREATSNTVSVTGVLPTTNPSMPNIPIYVGAFWRANQTGERVIRINTGNANLNNAGTWIASVSWLDSQWGINDGVVLSSSLPSSNILYTSSPGNAESYQVYPGSDQSLIIGEAAPNEYIQFRIGLKTAYTPTSTNPARYAVVMIVYGNGKWQRLFIRQGHDPDYLMRPGTIDPGVGISNRPNAVQFSPYNIKDPQNRIPAHRNDAFFPVNSGVFTDYPSMIGYQFTFNSGAPMYGRPPILGSGVNGWNFSLGVSGYWAANNRETCPNNQSLSYGGTTNYRRPNDGSISAAGNGAVNISEMRQSLWLNPPAGTVSGNNVDNVISGLYADGYFDRGALDTNGSSSGFYTVFYNYGQTPAPSNYRVFTASTGSLFYNPMTNASLFFPAGGRMDASTAILQDIGLIGGYWTATAYGNSNASLASFLSFDTNFDGQSYFIQMNQADGNTLYNIRCVK